MTASVTFQERLARASRTNNSLLCIGLDPVLEKLPSAISAADPARAIVAFNAAVIAATSDLVCAYKPNLGFYLAHGAAGAKALEATRLLIPPHIPAILDAKVGDVGSTASAYAQGYFDTWGFDAVTVNPYLGEDSLEPFLRHGDKGVLVVCKTSNRGSGDIQDLPASTGCGADPLYIKVAERVAAWSQRWPATLGLVVGATYPGELAEVRKRCPRQPILLPGVGAQEGDLEAALRAGLDAERSGLMVSASRAILYAGEDQSANWQGAIRSAACELRRAINDIRARRF